MRYTGIVAVTGKEGRCGVATPNRRTQPTGGSRTRSRRRGEGGVDKDHARRINGGRAGKQGSEGGTQGTSRGRDGGERGHREEDARILFPAPRILCVNGKANRGSGARGHAGRPGGRRGTRRRGKKGRVRGGNGPSTDDTKRLPLFPNDHRTLCAPYTPHSLVLPSRPFCLG